MIIFGIEFTMAQFVIFITQIILLLLALVILGKLSGIKNNSQAKKTEPQPAVPVASASADDEEELVAVLTAAVAACMDTTPDKIKISSYKEITNNRNVYGRSNWAKRGHEAQIRRFI